MRSKLTPQSLLRFLFLAWLKAVGSLVYPARMKWLSRKPDDWSDVSLVLILNHTSLFEFVYSIALPLRFLKAVSERLVVAIADKTMESPISGFVFSNVIAKTVAISRKRDDTWKEFLAAIEPEQDICIFTPEGRMKRPNGLDRNGKPMTVRRGVYEVLRKFSGKKMLIIYSEGLHHVLAPGQRFPRLFRRIAAKGQYWEVDDYMKLFADSPKPAAAIAADLEARRDLHCAPD